MKTKNILKSLLMSATLLMSGAMISCQADKDDDPVNFIAQISVDPENETANLGDTVHFTLDSNTDWTLVITDKNQQLLVEDALYSGKKGDGQDVWVKIASDLEEGSWVPGTKIDLEYRAKSYIQGIERTITAHAYIRVGQGYSDTTHEGTADDPLSVKEAIEKCKQLANEQVTDESYYVRGTIKSIKYPFSTEFGTANFNMVDAGSDDAEFTAYSVKYLENKSWLEGMKQVSVGDEVVVYGKLTIYNGTPETKSGTCYIYSLNGQTEAEEIEVPDPEFEASDVTLPYTLDTTLEEAKTSAVAYDSEHDITVKGLAWSVMGNSNMSPWRIGGKAITNEDRPVYTKQAIKENVAQIDITHGAAASITVNSFTVIVARDPAFKNVVSSLEQTFTASSTVTVNRPEDADWSNCYYKFLYNVTVTDANSNRFILFSKVVFSDGQGGGTVEPEPGPEEPGKGGVDVLDYEFTKVSGNGYTPWSDKVGESGAVYAGNSNMQNNVTYIQLRSSGNNSGIVTTSSGGKVTNISVKWNSSTSGRTLDVYAKKTAYKSAEDLYGDAAGELVGSLNSDDGDKGLDITGDYTHIGFRSKNGALYLDSVTITWEPAE